MSLPPRRWLLLRGLVREARHWGGFPAHLRAQGLEVLTPDLPGVGTERHRPSPWSVPAIVADLRARMPQDGVPTGLFAQSLGGMIALQWAATHPTDFTRVVVCNTSARDLSGLRDRLSWFARGIMLRAIAARGRLSRERLILSLVANSPGGRAHAEAFAALAAEAPIPFAVLVRQLVAAARQSAPPRVEAPLLVLGSRGDRMVSVDCSRAVAQRYGAPLALHADAGHDLPLDDAAWVAEHLLHFGAADPA